MLKYIKNINNNLQSNYVYSIGYYFFIVFYIKSFRNTTESTTIPYIY